MRIISAAVSARRHQFFTFSGRSQPRPFARTAASSSRHDDGALRSFPDAQLPSLLRLPPDFGRMARAVVATAMLVAVTACGSGGGASDASNSSGGNANPPPSGGAQTATAALAWDAVSATNLGGYRLYYGTSPGSYLQAPGQGMNVGKTTRYTVTGLAADTTYYFAVTAYNTTGQESMYSNEDHKEIE
jgi:hypothetical protein